MVLVDRDHLEHALVNLVLNARDAMPDGGTLTIETDTVHLDADDRRLRPPAAPGDYVRLTVSDTGAGIAAGVLPHILEPFSTTKPMWQGSGLGLSSVDGFVDQSGGFLVVETTIGRGSSFSIYLQRPDARDGDAASAPHGPTILVVDDEPGVRAVTARMLRELGYAVIEAGDADGPVRPFDGGGEHRPPRRGCRAARHERPGPGPAVRQGSPRPEVLLISGYPSDAAAVPAGATEPAFLAKPFTMDALGGAVRRLLKSAG